MTIPPQHVCRLSLELDPSDEAGKLARFRVHALPEDAPPLLETESFDIMAWPPTADDPIVRDVYLTLVLQLQQDGWSPTGAGTLWSDQFCRRPSPFACAEPGVAPSAPADVSWENFTVIASGYWRVAGQSARHAP